MLDGGKRRPGSPPGPNLRLLATLFLLLLLCMLLLIREPDGGGGSGGSGGGGSGGGMRPSSQVASSLVALADRNTALISQLVRTEDGADRLVGGAAPSPRPWLRIALMSVGRSSGAEYLLHALRALLQSHPARVSDPLRSSIEIVVVNNHAPPEAHSVLLRAKQLYGGRVVFVEKEAAAARACRATPKVKGDVAKEPVFRQTCDLVGGLEALLAMPPADHVLLMEDDWLVCPSALLALQYLLDKAYAYDEDWLALRVSYGFNGVVVRGGADLRSLRRHLESHPWRRPPDHLLFEWFSGERPDTKAYAAGRSYRVFRHNLFYHIGALSTLNQPKTRFTPGCYSLM